MAQHQGSVLVAILWMFFLSLLLFWLPVLGPLLAGFVGGRKAGNPSTALAAVCLPAAIVAAMVMLFSSAILGMPIIGFFAGMGTFVLALSHVVPLAIGALIGGATA